MQEDNHNYYPFRERDCLKPVPPDQNKPNAEVSNDDDECTIVFSTQDAMVRIKIQSNSTYLRLSTDGGVGVGVP